MKKAFKITNKKLITEMLSQAEYGVLALATEKPYAVPVNFVYLNNAIYFHGSPKGKKMRMLAKNNKVSFSVVSEATIIPSYFSSKENLACPASVFFKSIIIDGKADIVNDIAEIKELFSALMEKLQAEGNYKPFDSADYDKQFKALRVVKINIENISAKFKFGQNLNKERLQMVVKHLQDRATKIDLLTVKAILEFSKH